MTEQPIVIQVPGFKITIEREVGAVTREKGIGSAEVSSKIKVNPAPTQ